MPPSTEQAGGNDDGTFEPDLQNDGVAGDLLIQRIFENPADGMEGVQAAIDIADDQFWGQQLLNQGGALPGTEGLRSRSPAS
ncbi:hypothetical protein [Mycetocola sp.]|uniref:hypothetical protein n=1 Tax=Mycetocola sp. TaxID=1871042 RepID=UPI003988B959